MYLVHNVGPPTQHGFNVRPALQPIAGLMPVNRSRRWPNIDTELGDCPVFALTAIRVTLYASMGHYPDNKIHGQPNCEIKLGHRLRRWANIISTKTHLTTNIIVNIFFFADFFKHKST